MSHNRAAKPLKGVGGPQLQVLPDLVYLQEVLRNLYYKFTIKFLTNPQGYPLSLSDSQGVTRMSIVRISQTRLYFFFLPECSLPQSFYWLPSTTYKPYPTRNILIMLLVELYAILPLRSLGQGLPPCPHNPLGQIRGFAV